MMTKSHACVDEYWCVMVPFDAARRLVARDIASHVGAFVGAYLMPLRNPSRAPAPSYLRKPLQGRPVTSKATPALWRNYDDWV
jgi:hypothetical protein